MKKWATLKIDDSREEVDSLQILVTRLYVRGKRFEQALNMEMEILVQHKETSVTIIFAQCNRLSYAVVNSHRSAQ